jgi:phage shock protein C
MKKLYKSEKDKVLFGIIGGLSEYFEVDVVVLRLFFVFFVCLTGFFPGVLFYFVAALIVPDAPGSKNEKRRTVENEAEKPQENH